MVVIEATVVVEELPPYRFDVAHASVDNIDLGIITGVFVAEDHANFGATSPRTNLDTKLLARIPFNTTTKKDFVLSIA